MKTSAPKNNLYIATRESRLALTQSQMIADILFQRFGLNLQLLGMTTLGDQVLDRSLSKIGGKGVFVKELEQALSDGRAHIAVHSLKDMPMTLPEGFVLVAIPEREDPRDAFISNKYATLDDLPQGAIMGTSSLRRQVLLQALRPDLHIEMLRGNLDTRLRKLDEGKYDAIVLAAAGLKRLKLQNRIRMPFDVQQMIPSAGQGALGLEMHASQTDLIATITQLSHAPTYIACTAERAVSRSLGGSCSVPLAAHAVWIDSNHLALNAAWGDVTGNTPLIRASQTLEINPCISKDVLQQANALGEQVAQALIKQGAIVPDFEGSISG